jgi:sulfatase maturation enzyme AslB (radical SAM superfamily)
MKKLHVEASTFCNSRCPLCPRNLFGYNVKGVWPEVHLTLENFKTCLEKFPKREFVYFNGHLGDPMMNPAIESLADLTLCRTSITTNGSIGKKETWVELARKKIQVVFSIDGLQDTNHLYRQDVQWSKIMERADWFISASGEATWKFIVFRHNQHQIEEARNMSLRLGFKKFRVENHGRNYGPALDSNGKIIHWILPHDGDLEPRTYDVAAGIERYKIDHQNFNVESKKYKIDCLHLREKDTYINARGEIAPCCFHGYDMPGRPFVKLEDHSKLMATWNTTNCNPVCAMSCGK